MTSVALERCDRPLVRALESGEPAHAQPVRRGSPELLRVALSYVRSSAVTERVAQKAWLAVPRAIRHFEERASLKARTFRITVGVTEPRARREARSLPIFALVEELSVDAARLEGARWRSAPTGLDRLEQRDAARCVGETIAALPAQQRRVITLGDLRRLHSTEGWDEFCLTPGNRRALLRGRRRSSVPPPSGSNATTGRLGPFPPHHRSAPQAQEDDEHDGETSHRRAAETDP
jgi:DNA-directed RNA polymerase specialized sigma24 family protein